MRRLSPALLTVAMLGVVGLLVAAYFGKRLLFAQEQVPEDPLINIPMALTDLKPGTRITEAHVGLGKARDSRITRDIIRSNRVVVGRVVKNPITAAQPISTNDLYPPGEKPLPDLEPGMRAVTVPISSATSAVAGQYVDVHFIPSSDPDAESTGGQILTLFKGVKILEISGSTTGVMRGGTNVMLELTPEQANIVLLAKDRGNLELVYTPEGKGTGGVALNDEDRATLYEILGYKPEPEPEPEKPFRTEMFPGGSHQVNRFQEGVLNGNTGYDRGYNPNDNQIYVPPPARGGPNLRNAPPASSVPTAGAERQEQSR